MYVKNLNQMRGDGESLLARWWDCYGESKYVSFEVTFEGVKWRRDSVGTCMVPDLGSSRQARSQRGGTWVNVPPPSWIKRNFLAWIPDRWLPFNWCHMLDVATEALQMSDMHLSEGKCALSTLIFQKFSGAMPPDSHTCLLYTSPSPRD